MAQPKKPHRVATTQRKANTHPLMTHAAIAADIEAFRGAGGEIEVLGVTRTLLKIDPATPGTPDKEH